MKRRRCGESKWDEQRRGTEGGVWNGETHWASADGCAHTCAAIAHLTLTRVHHPHAPPEGSSCGERNTQREKLERTSGELQWSEPSSSPRASLPPLRYFAERTPTDFVPLAPPLHPDSSGAAFASAAPGPPFPRSPTHRP